MNFSGSSWSMHSGPPPSSFELHTLQDEPYPFIKGKSTVATPQPLAASEVKTRATDPEAGSIKGAECVGVTGLFFAGPKENWKRKDIRVAAAKKICARCTVRPECIEQAVSRVQGMYVDDVRTQKHDVIAGMTVQEISDLIAADRF